MDTAQPRFGEVFCQNLTGDGVPGEEAIAAYRRDGVVCLRGAFDDAWVEIINNTVEDVMNDASEAADHIKLSGDKGSFFYDTMMWRRFEPFRKFVFDSCAADLFMPLLDTKSLTFYYDFLIIKGPGCSSAATPWHHDLSYYPLNGHKIINCWTALDPIPLETALRFARRSHLNDTVYEATHFNPNKAYENLVEGRERVFDGGRSETDFDIISCEMSPGDTLVFNARTLHSAPGNTRNQRRGAFSTNWLGDDVTYNDIKQRCDPPHRGENLVHGGSMECESFPRVRPIASV